MSPDYAKLEEPSLRREKCQNNRDNKDKHGKIDWFFLKKILKFSWELLSNEVVAQYLKFRNGYFIALLWLSFLKLKLNKIKKLPCDIVV